MERWGVRKLVLLPLIAARRDFDLRVEAGEGPEAARAAIGEAWTAYNLWAAALARAEPDRFRACVAVDPLLLGEDWARDMIERGLAAGASAIKIMPAWIGVPPSDPGMRVVWELADEHGLPVVSQSGLTDYADTSHPDNFAPVARDYPRANVIQAHMGLGAEDRTAALLAEHANVFVDTSAWFNIVAAADSWLHRERGTEPPAPEQVAELLRSFGIDRVLFGTNYAIREADAPHQWIRSLPLAEDERAEIFAGTYRRVFGD
jgi:predicted TIM-barrel fold metal-dependent hydrolase